MQDYANWQASCCEAIARARAHTQECVSADGGPRKRHQSRVISVLPPFFIYWSPCDSVRSPPSWRDESVIFAKFRGIYKNKAGVNACKLEMSRLDLSAREEEALIKLRCRKKTKTLFESHVTPYLPQTLHSMKRNHIIGHHVTLAIHMVLSYMKNASFGDFRKTLPSRRFGRGRMQERHL